MTKLFLNRRTVFEFLVYILLLLPFLSFLVYIFFGVFFNFNNFYFLIYIFLIILSLSYIKLKVVHFKFFLSFIIILFINLIAYIRNLAGMGIIEFMRAISSYYIFIFIGWCLYKIYYEKNEIRRLLRMIVGMAFWISIINIFHFILLHTDNYIHNEWTITFNRYQLVTDYLMKLNKLFYDYIVISAQYNDVGFIRAVGYFFDTHSQYYMPLGASIILIFSKNIIRFKNVYLGVMLCSFFLSGIKTAYMTAILILLISLFKSGRLFLYIKRSVPLILLICFLFREKILHLILDGGMWKILFQLFEHIIYIPYAYIKYDAISFLIGGAPYLRDNPLFYSEVFLVTLTFYIGIVGIWIYLKPRCLLNYLKNDSNPLGGYLYILFFLSLTHYSVYMIGINNLLSALPFMFYFGVKTDKIVSGQKRA